MYILYKRVSINVKAGILPIRNFSQLQQHGSVIERISTAVSDGLNRRGYTFATWLHRILSPSKISEMDDRLIVEESYYQQRKKRSHISEDNYQYDPKIFDRVLEKMRLEGRQYSAYEFQNEYAKTAALMGEA